MSVSIRSRLLLLVLSVLLPAVAAALWLIVQAVDAERLANERTLRDTTRALSMVVDRELAQRATVARVLALSDSLDGAPAIDAAALAMFEHQARRAMEGLDGWIELGSPGRPLLDTRLPPGRVPATTQSTVPAAASFDIASDRSTELIEMPTIGALQPSAGGGSHAEIVEPVQRGGRTLLNVVVTIRPAELQRIVDAQALPAGWVGSVLDSRGMVVARQPGGVAYTGRLAPPDLRQQLKQRSEALLDSVSFDGAPLTAYFSTSPQGWTFVTAMPRMQRAGSSLSSAVLRISMAALLLLSLALAGALWVARGIARPVISLKRAAVRMQAGQPLQHRPTGIHECDEVVRAMAEAAESMQHARADLERQVEEAVQRTRLAEQRVSQSQRVEALGRLTGGVAHDFNNLLGVISNSAQLIQHHPQAHTPELQMPLAATLRAVEVGSRLTSHLLRFAGRRPARSQALELGRYLPELQELIETVLGKRIELSVAVEPATRAVTVDSAELELALINLALNARDAMPSGGQVRLRAGNARDEEAAGLAPGHYVLITFGDDGSGMDSDLAKHAFEPFFTTKEFGKGTGLGLSQVHGFCVQASGAARLASTPGLGTTVSLLLPANEGSPSAAAPEPPETLPGRGLDGVRVLLVEDNEELGAVTAALLGTYGCKVMRAADAAEALGVLQSPAGGVAFDVVLSDIVMPGAIDGVGLARQLRQSRPELPVVLISGYTTSLTAAREFVVLHKPCTQEQLIAALQNAVDPARQPGPQPQSEAHPLPR